MASILIIDDDEMVCRMLQAKVGRMGHEPSFTITLEDGLRRARSGQFDVVFLDVRMPDGNGLELIPEIRKTPSSPEVIIITGIGDPDGAELAIKSGAWDYVEKSSSINAMTLPLVRALQYRQEKESGKRPVVLNRKMIIGSSPEIAECINLVAQAASADANVLITGETGTGKELFANAIHANSRRANESFVVVDCTALPGNLIESMLFGHERGAFTGADRAQEGLIKQADRGTLFLDEVGELPLSLQKAFLRVLQERCFRPIGSKEEVHSNFRVLAATNRNLDQMVRSGQFREDLLYRLRTLTIELPPLRERKEDIRELVFHYTAKICDKYGMETKGFSPEFFEALAAYKWPGNVRELLNALEGAMSSAWDEPTLHQKHLSDRIRIHATKSSIRMNGKAKQSPEEKTPGISSLPSLKEFRETMQKKYLEDLMSFANNGVREACRISGLSRSHLYALLKKYEVSI